MNVDALAGASAVDSPAAVNSWLIRLSLGIFCCYLTIGIPLPVIPLYVHQQLGFGNFLVGLAVGIQFVATVLTRRHAGVTSDHQGPRLAMLRGLMICSFAGATYIIAALLPVSPGAKLVILFAGRLLLGTGESLLMTGGLTWGIALTGPSRAGRVMAWTGMALYAALAVGSPCGLALQSWGGFLAVSAVVTLLPLVALAIVFPVPAVVALAAPRTPFRDVVLKILRPGTGLFLQGVGFAGISAFITLYFAYHNWPRAGLALTIFGTAFVLVRAIFSGLPDRLGGFRVAWVCLTVELCGQLLLWRADSSAMALAGAGITGLGCSLVFPSLGVEAVKRVPAQSRGTALGAFAAFQDLSYAVTGPVAGVIATKFGYPSIFLFGAGAALLGVLIALPQRVNLRS